MGKEFVAVYIHFVEEISLTNSYTPTYLTPSLSLLQTTSRDINLTKLLFKKHTQLITYVNNITVTATRSNIQTVKVHI